MENRWFRRVVHFLCMTRTEDALDAIHPVVRVLLALSPLLRLRIRGRLIIFFLKFFGLNKEIKKSPRLFFTSLAMKIFVLIDQNLQD